MKFKLRILTAAALVASGFAMAQPSEYFLWKNPASGKVVCDVAAPGADWVKTGGPFEDPSCKYKMAH